MRIPKGGIDPEKPVALAALQRKMSERHKIGDHSGIKAGKLFPRQAAPPQLYAHKRNGDVIRTPGDALLLHHLIRLDHVRHGGIAKPLAFT